MAIQNRYDFVLLFDVKDGNPNGDPDAGNLPRLDAETGCGLVTDVCIKRKIRNYIQITKEYERPFDIYVKEKAVLGRAHTEVFSDLGIMLGKESRILIPQHLRKGIKNCSLPDGITIEEKDDDSVELIISADAGIKQIKDELKTLNPEAEKEILKFLNDSLKGAKARQPEEHEVAKGREEMCKRFYDIRTFGAVMSLKSAPNCGQVRGPVQFTFSRSIDPIIVSEHSITRMAVATEKEAENQAGGNRTMGRKFTVPYGLYITHGFVSASLAEQTGFNEEDMKLLLEALQNMFEHDRSAARGEMTTRGLYVFKHESKLGNAQAHTLFDRVKISRQTEGPARNFKDYKIEIDTTNIPQGVVLDRIVG